MNKEISPLDLSVDLSSIRKGHIRGGRFPFVWQEVVSKHPSLSSTQFDTAKHNTAEYLGACGFNGITLSDLHEDFGEKGLRYPEYLSERFLGNKSQRRVNTHSATGLHEGGHAFADQILQFYDLDRAKKIQEFDNMFQQKQISHAEYFNKYRELPDEKFADLFATHHGVNQISKTKAINELMQSGVSKSESMKIAQESNFGLSGARRLPHADEAVEIAGAFNKAGRGLIKGVNQSRSMLGALASAFRR